MITTYEETLAYLYARLPMFQRVGKAAYKADLNTTIALCTALDEPQLAYPSVHIAGTNGKGSTSHMIASVLQEAGLKVGLFTSPHLKDFRERIKVSGTMIAEDAVTEFVQTHRSVLEQHEPSFFEWTALMAFAHFRSQQVDIAVMETGLGGRLDSTNVVRSIVAVITNIGWDHADLLGGDLRSIAAEKAGIIKQGVPVILGDIPDELLHVFLNKAKDVEAPVHQVDQSTRTELDLDLAGDHQHKNARTAVKAVMLLRDLGWPIKGPVIEAGLRSVRRNTGLMGRWQLLSETPRVIADVAHNEDGIRVVLGQLAHERYAKLHVVLGMVGDKDLHRILSQLPKTATYYFCKADIPRGLDVNELHRQAQSFALQGDSFPSVCAALKAAKTVASPEDLILVTGSAFVVAEVL